MSLPASRALEKIQKGTISPGYFLLGTEIYWRDRICTALRDAAGLKPDSLGLAEFDLRQDPLVEVLDKARSRNLLADRQVLFVKNAQALLARKGREAEGSSDASASPKTRPDDLAAYFHSPDPDSILVFEMMDVELDSDDWKERDKVKARLEAFDGSFEGRCEVILLTAPASGEAMALVRAAAAERGRKISPQAAERLISACRNNMAIIGMEIEKVCLFDPDKTEIELDDLSQVMAGAADDSGLELSEAIGSRNVNRALQVLNNLRGNGKYLPLVISEVARYLRQLILLKEGKARDPRQAGRVLWDAKILAPQSSLPGLVDNARNFTGAELLRGLRLAFEADLALRCSPVDEGIVVERFILDLIRGLKKAGAH